jgi:hypothetical protein
VSSISIPYLGKPGAMRALPSPTGPVTASPSRQDAAKTLLSGGTAVIGRLQTKKTYTLPYDHLDAAGADLLLGFYQRLFGTGPFVYVDPSVRNVLGLDVSTMGARSNAPIGWAASSGSVSRDTIAPPAAAATSGVLLWAGAAANATLQPGSAANTANTAAAPVYLPAEACTVSLYLLASSTVSVTLQLVGYNSAGAVTGSTIATTVTVGSAAWTPVAVSAAAGAAGVAGSAFVLPRIKLGGTAPATLSVAAAQLEYGPAATAWQPGFGSPRVLPPSSPGREVQQTQDITTNHTFTLAEV